MDLHSHRAVRHADGHDGHGSALAQQDSLSGLGIVLLHGKGGTPTTGIEGLHESLKRAGALVEAPEMPWSARRIYDATYDQAMDEIDAAVENA